MLIRLMALFVATVGIVAMPRAVDRAASAPPFQLTDARILGTLGAGDIDQTEAAKLAMTKANGSAVRDYAKMMVHDHEASFKKNTEIAKRYKLARVMPEDSAMARAHKQEMAQLNLLSGSAFDLAFLQAMVADHATLIKDVNTTLLPAAQHKELKEFIRELLPVLTSHQVNGQTLLDKQK